MSDFPAHPHLVVATPCYGGMVSCNYTVSLLGLQQACAQLGIGITFKLLGGDSLITRARNLAVQQFLSLPDATHLLFIDADIGFAPEQALALLAADKDVCGAVYPLKRLDWPRIRDHAVAGVGDLPASALNYVVDLLGPDAPSIDQAFFRVRYLGTGFMMIKRNVFARMAARYPETHYRTLHLGVAGADSGGDANAFFDCMIDPDSGAYLSEDYTFCKRWLDMDGDIWAYAASRLTHVGTQSFDGDLSAMLDLMRAGARPSVV